MAEKKYIDADLLLNCPIKIVGHFDLTNGKAQNFVAIPVAEIENAPAADVVEVRHGNWIQVDKNKCRCSNCDITTLIAQYPHGDKNYCPYCGARMDGDGNEQY